MTLGHLDVFVVPPQNQRSAQCHDIYCQCRETNVMIYIFNAGNMYDELIKNNNVDMWLECMELRCILGY